MNRFVVVSGCSGGGKSSLLAELERRGYPVVMEPGRRIVVEQLSCNGRALPWVDMTEFLRRAIAMAQADLSAANHADRWVFFDRGLIDAMAGLQHVTGDPLLEPLAHEDRAYHPLVFLTPPWPEIYVQDDERRHGLDTAIEEYFRLLKAYQALGYVTCIIPKASVAERAEFVLSALEAGI
jgi:predicted ATPase